VPGELAGAPLRLAGTCPLLVEPAGGDLLGAFLARALIELALLDVLVLASPVTAVLYAARRHPRYLEPAAVLFDVTAGPLLWQLPGSFRRDDSLLAAALEELPAGRHAFEFRHPSWFTDEVHSLLRARDVRSSSAITRSELPEPRGDRFLALRVLPLRTARLRHALAGRAEHGTEPGKSHATPYLERLRKESAMALATLNDVFAEQIEDLYSAETQLVEALPKIAEAAKDKELREAIKNHLKETRGHVDRLSKIRGSLGITGTRRCKGMAGLLAEGEETLKQDGEGPAKDAAIIAAAQRVEHYEIAAYGTAKTLADKLGYDDAKKLLDETLTEENKADKLLTKIATGGLFRSGLNDSATTNGK
jgi:ferritin-like metal-binding protein YciE